MTNSKLEKKRRFGTWKRSGRNSAIETLTPRGVSENTFGGGEALSTVPSYVNNRLELSRAHHFSLCPVLLLHVRAGLVKKSLDS